MVAPNYPKEKLERVMKLVKERQAEGWNLHQIASTYGIDREWLRDNWPDPFHQRATLIDDKADAVVFKKGKRR